MEEEYCGFKSEYDCGFWLLVGIPELQQIKDNNKGEVMAHQYCSFQKGRVVDDETFQILGSLENVCSSVDLKYLFRKVCIGLGKHLERIYAVCTDP